jgi:hypothetical protein
METAGDARGNLSAITMAGVAVPGLCLFGKRAA